MTTCDKILGIQVDDNLTWNSHFNFLSKKLSSYMWLLSKIRTYLSTEHRILFYNAYIKPHLDYCSLIWSNTSSININKISRLQRRSCKLILGMNGIIDAFQRLKILSFDQSIFLSKAKMMYKIHTNIEPSYLNEITNTPVNPSFTTLNKISNWSPYIFTLV